MSSIEIQHNHAVTTDLHRTYACAPMPPAPSWAETSNSDHLGDGTFTVDYSRNGTIAVPEWGYRTDEQGHVVDKLGEVHVGMCREDELGGDLLSEWVQGEPMIYMDDVNRVAVSDVPQLIAALRELVTLVAADVDGQHHDGR